MEERMDHWMRTPAVASGPMLKEEIGHGKCTQEHGPPCTYNNRKLAKSIVYEIELKHQPAEKKHRGKTQKHIFKNMH